MTSHTGDLTSVATDVRSTVHCDARVWNEKVAQEGHGGRKFLVLEFYTNFVSIRFMRYKL